MNFLNTSPLLAISLIALLGFLTPLKPLLILFLIPLSVLRKKPAVIAGFLLYPLAALMNTLMLPTIDEELKGTFNVKIDQIKESITSFGRGVQYQGRIASFETAQKKISHCNIPCTFYTREKKELVADQVLIEGTYCQSRLKPAPKSLWIPVKNTHFTETRAYLKKKVQEVIEEKFTHPDTKALISGLVTGNFDDYFMSREFSRLGLSHLMAISGFHFSLMANILSVVFINTFKRRTATLLMMSTLSTYFLFLGASASVLRAWTMIAIALGEHLVEKRGDPLNSLGASLLLLLLVNPLETLKPAFWLSYGITASILLFSAPSLNLLNKIFKERTKKEIERLTPLNRWGHFALDLLKKGFALNISVTIFALPLTLYFFHKFPWISLLTNLFFPPLVGVSLLLLLLSFILFPIGKTIDLLNDAYTHILLSLMTNFPLTVDFVWRIPAMEPATLALILLPLFLWGLSLKRKMHHTSEASEPCDLVSSMFKSLNVVKMSASLLLQWFCIRK